MTPADAYNLYRSADILFKARFDDRLEPLVRELDGHSLPTQPSR